MSKNFQSCHKCGDDADEIKHTSYPMYKNCKEKNNDT